jgi:hypothetical protein
MALYSDLPVYKSTYDLLLAIFRFTKDFGKEYKYTVGESLKKETIEKNQRTVKLSKNPALFHKLFFIKPALFSLSKT